MFTLFRCFVIKYFATSSYIFVILWHGTNSLSITPHSSLHGVEGAVDAVLSSYRSSITPFPVSKGKKKQWLKLVGGIVKSMPLGYQREELAVSSRLWTRLHSFRNNGDCPRCWLQQAHCICDRCPPLTNHKSTVIRRIFVYMHHKEICLAVDTAKLLFAAFPAQGLPGSEPLKECAPRYRDDMPMFEAYLVVSGIRRENQPAMDIMLRSLEDHKTKSMVLWPSEDAMTVASL